MLFTSYLRSSMVLKVGEIFLFLPKHTGISVLQVGGVLALMRRGAQGRSGHAARRCPALPDLRRLRRLLATLPQVVVCAGQARASAS
jgi:hypothetical protein